MFFDLQRMMYLGRCRHFARCQAVSAQRMLT
jgi:hypothetical protein